MNFLSPKQLKNARSCERYKELALMHLKNEKSPELERTALLKNALKESVFEESLPKAIMRWGRVFETDLPAIISPEAKETLQKKGERFLKWFYENEYKALKKNAEYSFLLDDICISGKSDLLIKKEDKLSFMDISLKKPEYSDAGRSPQTRPEGSIELLSRMVTAKEINADAMIAYLTSKKDTSSELEESFETAKGRNLAVLKTTREAERLLREALRLQTERDCRHCTKKKMCRAKRIEEAAAPPSKKINRTISAPTKKQEHVIRHENGPMAVTAVPGAGKTRALTERLVNLIKKGVPANKIFFATFTRKAAEEIKIRVRRSIKGKDRPTVGTFHSIALKIIKECGMAEGELKIATDTAKAELIEESVKLVPKISGYSYDYPYGESGVYRKLRTAFDALMNNPDKWLSEYEKDSEKVLEAFKIYKALYEEKGFIEYDDLIKKAVTLLKDPEILKRYHEKWKYFMVDEFQDVSKAEAEMAMLLASENNNLLVVGDDDQSIYEWRNGSDYYLRNFQKFYPEAEVVFMEENFRSTGKILDAAQSLIMNNKGRYEKTINAVGADGSAPLFAENLSDEELIDIIKSSEYPLEDICIIGRSNSLLEKIKEKLLLNNIPSTGPRKYITDTEEFDLLYCFLFYATNGMETPTELIYRLLKYIGIEPEKEGEKIWQQIAAMPAQISGAMAALTESGSTEELIKNLWTELTGLKKTPAIDALTDRAEEELADTAEKLFSLLKKMLRFNDCSEVEQERAAGSINLLTAHKAKGKEFPFVIIYGVEDYCDTKEERNLLYVAMTRAEKKLLIIQRTESIPMLIREIKGLRSLERRMA